MLEEKIDKLTAAVAQLTVTAEALLETLRRPSPATGWPAGGNLTVTGSGTAMTISGPGNDLTVTGSGTTVLPYNPADAAATLEAIAPVTKPKKAKAPKVEAPAAPAEEPAPAPAPAAEEPAPAPEPAKKQYTLADLREAAQKALDAGKLNDVVDLNKKYNVKRISEVSPDLYPEIIAKLEAINGQA